MTATTPVKMAKPRPSMRAMMPKSEKCTTVPFHGVGVAD
jgi:hypothetical protein